MIQIKTFDTFLVSPWVLLELFEEKIANLKKTIFCEN